MLRDLESVVVKEVLSALDHLQTLLEALRRHLSHSNDTIAVGDLAGDRELHAGDLAGHLDELDGLAGRADGFEVAVGFTDPVHGAALLLQRLDRLRAAGDEDAVEHGAAHALEVVVGFDALGAVLVLARGVDGRAAGADGVGQGASTLESADHGVVGDRVVSVGDHDGNAARLDGGDFGHEVGLAETL